MPINERAVPLPEIEMPRCQSFVQKGQQATDRIAAATRDFSVEQDEQGQMLVGGIPRE